MQYSGFWRRVGASLLDSLVLGMLTSPIGGIVTISSANFSPESMMGMSEDQVFAMMLPIMGMAAVAAFISFIIQMLYFAMMESSKYQATLGKMALGIIITDTDGLRISFGRALGRNLGKMVSSLILMIGYIMVAFTSRKQGLHDLMAGTLVIKKESSIPPSQGGRSDHERNPKEFIPERYEDDRMDE